MVIKKSNKINMKKNIKRLLNEEIIISNTIKSAKQIKATYDNIRR